MGLEASPDRPITDLVVRAITGRSLRRAARRGPYAPPACPTPPDADGDVSPAEAAALSEWLLRRLVAGEEPVVGLRDEIADDAVVWTPAIYVSGEEEVLPLLADTEEGEGPITEVAVVVGSVDVALPRVYVEWRLEGRFTSACFVEDDLLVRPTGRLVETAGVLVVTFAGARVSAMHCYYDDVALLEQLLDA